MFEIDFNRLDKMAWNGSVDEVLPWYENIYFQNMAILYEQARMKMCSKEQAAEAKGHLRHEVQNMVNDVEFQLRLLDNAAFRYKETELARNEYRKNRTLENADKLMAAFDGVEVYHDGE